LSPRAIRPAENFFRRSAPRWSARSLGVAGEGLELEDLLVGGGGFGVVGGGGDVVGEGGGEQGLLGDAVDGGAGLVGGARAEERDGDGDADDERRGGDAGGDQPAAALGLAVGRWACGRGRARRSGSTSGSGRSSQSVRRPAAIWASQRAASRSCMSA
jgi:hypothetical protein